MYAIGIKITKNRKQKQGDEENAFASELWPSIALYKINCTCKKYHYQARIFKATQETITGNTDGDETTSHE